MFIIGKDNFLTNTENIKLGSITEKLNGSKCVVPGEKGNTIRGEKKNDPYTVLTTQRSS